jgi:hypothetical protein
VDAYLLQVAAHGDVVVAIKVPEIESLVLSVYLGQLLERYRVLHLINNIQEGL